MHFENMGVSFFIPGQEEGPNRNGAINSIIPGRITKWDMIRWIKKAGIDEDTKESLIKQVSRYPANTMHHFYQNILCIK